MFLLVEVNATVKDSLANNNKILFNAGAQYVSNLTYAGRKDLSSVPIFLPNLTLISTKGFFLGSAAYINASVNSITADGLSFTPGYVFNFDKKKKFGGVISATKYFFNDSSNIILNAFDATTDASLYYQLNSFKFSLTGSYQFGKEQDDFVSTIELLKEISVLKSLKFVPTASLLAGTQSFFQTYYTQTTRQRRITNPGSGSPVIPLLPGSGGTQQPSESIINETVTQEEQREIRKFQLLAINASIPVKYQYKKLQLNFTPYFIKPLNQVQNFASSDSDKIFFLFNTGISYTF
jgi:hypothetical protein